MRNNEQLSNARRAALILEARAGLIPASDEIAEEHRARMDRIGRTVKSYAMLVTAGSGDWDDLAITDILADLRHYCDSKGLAFHELDKAAYEHYLAAVADSGEGVYKYSQ
jgi:hypothetical protein